jgi:perosamine synthetase
MTAHVLASRPSRPITRVQSNFPPEDIARFHIEAERILTGRLSMGPWLGRFEAAAAEAHGARFAIAMSSCTAALEVSLLACGIRPGDRVIVPVQTFVATGMSVYNIGARPVFADIRAETLCLDPAELQRLPPEGVKAVIVVHFGGLISPDVERIQEICRRRGWVLIEDAAHAHGAAYDGKPAGSFGRTACFSYHPAKVLTAGEGGMIVTDDEAIAGICRSYQYRGQDFDLPGEQFTRPYGRNTRLPELSALLGVLQYGRLREFVRQRRALAAIYDEALSEEPALCLPVAPPRCLHNYWLYSVLLPPGLDREMLQKRMKEEYDIEVSWSYFPPLHLMPVFRKLYGGRPGDLPVSEDVLARTLCLPIHPLIDTDDAGCVARCFLQIYRELATG